MSNNNVPDMVSRILDRMNDSDPLTPAKAADIHAQGLAIEQAIQAKATAGNPEVPAVIFRQMTDTERGFAIMGFIKLVGQMYQQYFRKTEDQQAPQQHHPAAQQQSQGKRP